MSEFPTIYAKANPSIEMELDEEFVNVPLTHQQRVERRQILKRERYFGNDFLRQIFTMKRPYIKYPKTKHKYHHSYGVR